MITEAQQTAEGTTTTASEATADAAAPKAKRTTKVKPKPAPKAKEAAKPAATKPVKPKPTPKAERPTKPSIPAHTFKSGYDGPSDVLTSNASRTAIDLSRFGQHVSAPMTARDEAAVAGLRSTFGAKAFQRSNLDAGILRRLGERGCIVHVSGSAVEATATFRLTNKGLGKAEPRARKVA